MSFYTDFTSSGPLSLYSGLSTTDISNLDIMLFHPPVKHFKVNFLKQETGTLRYPTLTWDILTFELRNRTNCKGLGVGTIGISVETQFYLQTESWCWDWTGSVKLSCLQPLYYLALPKFQKHLDYTITERPDFQVVVSWIADFSTTFNSPLCLLSLTCYDVKKRYTVISGKCKAMSSGLLLSDYLSVFRKTCNFSTVYQLNNLKAIQYSWNSTYKLCNDTGAHLPVFTSRKDLEIFLAELRVREDGPVFDAVYIGLQSTNNNAVSVLAHLVKVILAHLA